MPDDNSTLQRAREWFHSRLPQGFPCPACKSNDWGIGSDVQATLSLQQTAAGNVVGAERLLPILPLVCNHCGYVQFFSAISAGLLRKQVGQAPPAAGEQTHDGT